jgi:hypothetical protein
MVPSATIWSIFALSLDMFTSPFFCSDEPDPNLFVVGRVYINGEASQLAKHLHGGSQLRGIDRPISLQQPGNAKADQNERPQ